MLLIVMEAFGALLVLVLIVWWTMFSGRDKGERIDNTPTQSMGETLWTVAEGIPPVTARSTDSTPLTDTRPAPLSAVKNVKKT